MDSYIYIVLKNRRCTYFNAFFQKSAALQTCVLYEIDELFILRFIDYRCIVAIEVIDYAFPAEDL